MQDILTEHNTTHRRFSYPVIQTVTSQANKSINHVINVVGKKLTGETVTIHLSIKADVLNYGPTIFFDIISSVPYTDGKWTDHPFLGLKLYDDSENIQVADHIDDTLPIRKIFEDLIVPDNWKKYVPKSIETYSTDQIKSTITNSVVKFIGSRMFDDEHTTINVRVIALELHHTDVELPPQIAIKISVEQSIKEGESWDLHPFRFLKKNIDVKNISGIVNDTPMIRQMIHDLVRPDEIKLYTSYYSDYRSKMISNLSTMFIKKTDTDLTQCRVINKLIGCLQLHWS
jgi:hypothetical protein